ncbi:hypothetical protein QHF83_51515 [Polyangium sp. 15x6]|nr:hypothetical protein [Polyangium sp. 15x6]
MQSRAPASYGALALQPGRLLVENEAQRFATFLDRKGIVVSSDAEPWSVSMRTAGWGCEGAISSVTDAEPEADGNRIRYGHDGLEEWYLNGPLGLEQGFVLAEAPRCAGPKVVTLELGGDLRAELDDADGDGRGESLQWRDAEGRSLLAYADLFVKDAAGKALPSWLSVEAGRVSIHVDDTDATYPVEIDPLIVVQQGKLLANDGAAGDWFGISVAVSGDTALVGARADDDLGSGSGSAYVFTRTAGAWSLQAKLLASDGMALDYFGSSVALDGDTALVGTAYGDNRSSYSGAAYVFVRSGTTWTEQARIWVNHADFGHPVALSGDTALMTASSNSVYVFVRSGTTWAQQAFLESADSAWDDSFGDTIAISGNTALIGAPQDDDKGSNSGSAYVFVRSGTTWTQQAKIVAADGAAYDRFGTSVAIAGETALIGAPYDGDKGLNAGSAYVFVRNGTTWSGQAKLLASDGAGDHRFGSSVALSGNAAVVGAEWQGYTYLFLRSGTTWTQNAKLLGNGSSFGEYGSTVAMSGDAVLVGEYRNDDLGTDAGAAYVFSVSRDPDGTACTSGTDCASGFCVDGVCCNSACGGGATNDCQACSVATGALADGTCGPRVQGSVCRAAAGVCDAADVCNGSSLFCPADAKVSAGTVCRAAVDVCDKAETCNGSSNNCPSDTKASASTVCRAAVDVCDQIEFCSGFSNTCPADSKKSAATVCRASAGACDAAETCDGSSDVCPADAKVAAGTECRASAGACDTAEACDGSSDACPADAKVAAGTECRASAGVCDLAEVCNGASNTCPADIKAGSSTVCRISAGPCDVAEACNGFAAACPSDLKRPSGATCRAAAGACDAAETCDGASDACPVDAKIAAGTVCRAKADLCDTAEVCDGSSNPCPVDGKLPSGTVCRASVDLCDAPEACDGAANACPADAKVSAGTVCRGSVGACDVPESCNGTSNACPVDARVAAGTQCRDKAGSCDVAESCNGLDGDCPADLKVAAGTECRAKEGVCDVAEACDGSNDECPADTKDSGTECRPAMGPCDVAELCNGVDVGCPADGVASVATDCRLAAGPCDIPEKCDGFNKSCTPDVVAPLDGWCFSLPNHRAMV